MKILFSRMFMILFFLSPVFGANFTSNLVKGGKYICYKNGDVLLCFESLCANALFEEVQGKTSTAQRKHLCSQENKKSDFTGKYMLRSLTNPGFVREFKGVTP